MVFFLVLLCIDIFLFNRWILIRLCFKLRSSRVFLRMVLDDRLLVFLLGIISIFFCDVILDMG